MSLSGSGASTFPPELAEVTVVVVTHHSAHCVDDMARQLAGFSHVVVVDNASDDGTSDRIRQRLPGARIIPLPDNLGFGAANNIGLAESTTPYALLLNPDCHIAPEAVAQLVRTAGHHPHAVIVAPQLVDDRDRPQLNYGWPRWTGPSRGPGADGLTCVGYACAAAWLIRSGAEPGGRPWRFDEGFFLYYEDEDLCARVFKAGQSVLVEPRAQAHHANRGSVKGRFAWGSEWRRGYHHSRSKVRFLALHHSLPQAQRVRRTARWVGGLEVLARVLTLQPRLLARSLGRWMGMWTAPLPDGTGLANPEGDRSCQP